MALLFLCGALYYTGFHVLCVISLGIYFSLLFFLLVQILKTASALPDVVNVPAASTSAAAAHSSQVKVEDNKFITAVDFSVHLIKLESHFLFVMSVIR